MSLNCILQAYAIDSDTENDCSESVSVADVGKDDGGTDCDNQVTLSKSTEEIGNVEGSRGDEICEGEKEVVIKSQEPISDQKSLPNLEAHLVKPIPNSDGEKQIQNEESEETKVKEKTEEESLPISKNEKNGTETEKSELWPFTHCKIILSRGPLNDKEGPSQGWVWEGSHFVYYDKILSVNESDDLANKIEQTVFERPSNSPSMTPSPIPEVQLETVSEIVENVDTEEKVPKTKKRKQPINKKSSKRPKQEQLFSEERVKRSCRQKQETKEENEPKGITEKKKDKSTKSHGQSKINNSNEPMSSSSSPTTPQPDTPSQQAAEKEEKTKTSLPSPSKIEEMDSTLQRRRSSRKRKLPSPPPQLHSKPIPSEENQTVPQAKNDKNKLTDDYHHQPTNQDNLVTPVTNEDMQVEIVYKCPYCLIVYVEPEGLIKHLAVHDILTKVSPDNPQEKDNQKPLNQSQKQSNKGKQNQSQDLQPLKDSSSKPKKVLRFSRGTKEGYDEDHHSTEKLECDYNENSIKPTDPSPEPSFPRSILKKPTASNMSASRKNAKAVNDGKEMQTNCKVKLATGHADKAILNSHHGGNQAINQGKNAIKCAYCMENFKLPSSLWKHLLEIHPGKVRKQAR